MRIIFDIGLEAGVAAVVMESACNSLLANLSAKPSLIRRWRASRALPSKALDTMWAKK